MYGESDRTVDKRRPSQGVAQIPLVRATDRLHQVDEAEDAPPLPLQTSPSTPHEQVPFRQCR